MREFSRPQTMRAAMVDTASKFFGNKHSGGTKHGGGNKNPGGDKKPSGGKAGGRRPRKAPTDVRRSSGVLRAGSGLGDDYCRPKGRRDERETLVGFGRTPGDLRVVCRRACFCLLRWWCLGCVVLGRWIAAHQVLIIVPCLHPLRYTYPMTKEMCGKPPSRPPPPVCAPRYVR